MAKNENPEMPEINRKLSKSKGPSVNALTQKTKTLKHWKPTETVLNQKIPIATRQLLKSNQIGTSILFDIANEHNCFKI